MLAKYEEIYRLVCRYIEDIANNIEEAIDDLIKLQRMIVDLNMRLLLNVLNLYNLMLNF